MVPCVVVPILNRPDLLDRCLKSIDYPVETLIVVDNGGVYDADMMSWVVDRQLVKNSYVWSFPSNLGVATSWNLGIKATPHADGWILLNSDAWFEPGQLEVFYNDCTPDAITLTIALPSWCCAWVGSQVVERVGLFSEDFYPAYFEDTDWQERATRINTEVKFSQAKIGHDNSSTIRSDDSLADKNQRSFQANQELYALRWQSGLPDAGHWDLKRRRDLGWD